MEKGWNITIIICSLMFGLLFGFGLNSLWFGIGSAIVCYILLFIGCWFSAMFEELDNELKELRNKKN